LYNTSTADESKVTAEDMNSIKTVVNSAVSTIEELQNNSSQTSGGVDLTENTLQIISGMLLENYSNINDESILEISNSINDILLSTAISINQESVSEICSQIQPILSSIITDSVKNCELSDAETEIIISSINIQLSSTITSILNNNLSDIINDSLGDVISDSLSSIINTEFKDSLLSSINSSITDSFKYTINGMNADDVGNFSITADSLSAALSDHTHTISQISGLQTSLNNKSSIGHTHEMISGLVVNSIESPTLTGTVILSGGENINISANGNILNIDAIPFTTNLTDSITDISDESSIKIFSGTLDEWNLLIKDESVKYLVFITG
jgi:hypothetical protein